MQEIRHFKPSTVSRRFSVVAGFYRTAVIDGVLDHSPAEHVRRPAGYENCETRVATERGSAPGYQEPFAQFATPDHGQAGNGGA
jgi:hypothetical protein